MRASFECISPNELDAGLINRWREIQAGQATLASPYFNVEYLQAVAQACPTVQIGIIQHHGVVRGFFPFERRSRYVAGPVGGRLSDFHGLVADPTIDVDAHAMLRGFGLRIWDFDHVPAAQSALAAHAIKSDVSPILDLSLGYEAYLQRKKAAGGERLSGFIRKARKFEREVGKFRFEADSRDPRAFDQVVAWKREQCLRTGVPDFLSWGWTTRMLQNIWEIRSNDFGGRLSVLWHDETILAAHFGMRNARVWHWWFPTYNPAFAKSSPGGILLLRVAEVAAQQGHRYLDLGKGEDAYKSSFATDELPLVEGSVMVPSLSSTWRRTCGATTQFLKQSAVMQPARTAFRTAKRWAGAAPAQRTHEHLSA